jgi:hypothetical protein
MSATEQQMSDSVDRKRWTSLVARAALKGWQLWRSDAADGPLRFFAGRWGMVQVLADADAVDAWLDSLEAAR